MRTQVAGATVSSAGGFVPGRLYSGLEIMKEVQGSQIFLLAQMLGDFAERCSKPELEGEVIDNEFDHDTFKTILAALETSRLPVSINIAATYRIMMFEANPRIITYSYLAPQLNTIRETVFAELRTMLFFRMDDDLRKFFEQPSLFGEGVSLKFPTASFDIEEGGKCLALGRPTACVFHMMRTMEVGLKALAKELKIPYAPSWESYIKQIEANITTKHKSKSKKWKAIEPFYRDALGNLISIKIAWRNPTMHIVRNYTSGEAEDVLRTVRTFMQRLSERLSQV